MAAPSAPMPRATGKALDRWLRGQASGARPLINAAVATGLVGGVLLIAQAWLLARIVDAVVIAGQGLEAVWPWLWGLLAIFVLRAIASASGEIVAFEAGARVVLAVRERLQAHIAALGPAWTRAQRTGDVVTTTIDGVETLHRYYAAYLPQMALSACIPLAILVFVVPADWISGVIMVLSAPLIPLFMILIGKGTEELNQSQWRKLARMSAHVFDAIEGLTTLKLFNASRAEAAVVAAIADDYRESTMKVLRVAFLSSLALEFFATVSIAMVAVFIGFRLYDGQLHFLQGFFVLLLAPEFYRPLRAMGTQYHARMEAIGASEAIVALLNTRLPERAALADVDGASLPSGRVREVRFERVDFRYGAEPVLHDVSFTLARGERVALVGPSGAGKTTLTQLLLGFLAPERGRILVGRHRSSRPRPRRVDGARRLAAAAPDVVPRQRARQHPSRPPRGQPGAGAPRRGTGRRPANSSPSCRRATRRCSATVAKAFPEARSNGSRSPASSSKRPTWWCSTRPAPGSTMTPPRPSRAPSRGSRRKRRSS